MQSGSCSNSINFLYGLSADPIGSSRSTADEEKAIAACKSHSEAERRRRKRINGHLATLRTLLPNTIKTDKASLLAEVVRRIRELKNSTAELTTMADDDGCNTYSTANISNEYMFPSETDELKLCYCDSGTIKATLCCEDRTELISEMTMALMSVQARVVKAEMATIGGRTKSVLWVQVLGGGGGGGDDGLVALQRALKVVIDGAALLPGSGQVLPGNKRPRSFHY